MLSTIVGGLWYRPLYGVYDINYYWGYIIVWCHHLMLFLDHVMTSSLYFCLLFNVSIKSQRVLDLDCEQKLIQNWYIWNIDTYWYKMDTNGYINVSIWKYKLGWNSPFLYYLLHFLQFLAFRGRGLRSLFPMKAPM